MVSPWCHGVGGVWGRHGEVAVVFLLQIAVGATWGGSGAPGKQVFHGSGLIARGQLGICRGDCGVVKRSHRSRTVRTRRSGHGAGGALIVRGRLGPAEVAAELRGNRFSTEAGLLLGAGSGPPGWLVGGVERHTVRGRFGSCRGGCGAVKRRAVRGRHFQPAAGPHPCGLGSGPHQGWSAVAGRTSPL